MRGRRRPFDASGGSAPAVPLLLYWGIRGGGARYTFELARAMTSAVGDRAAAPVLVSLNRANELRAEFERLAAAGAVRLDVRDFSTWRAPGWRFVVPGKASLWRVIRDHGGPVVITMGNPLSVVVGLVARLSGAALVVVVHDARPHLDERAGIAHWSIRASARLARRVVTLSESVRRSVAHEWHIPGSRLRVIEHGPFYADELRSRGTERGERAATNVLFFGRIRPYKGLALLLSAWPAVLAEEPDARLVIAGEGDYAPSDAALAALGATRTDELSDATGPTTPGVRVVPRWLRDEEIVELALWSDVIVLPYLEASQSGIVGIAQSAGARVVSTGIGGVSEQTRDGDVIVDARPESLAAGVVAALRQPRVTGAVEPMPGSSPIPGSARTWEDLARSFLDVVSS